MVENTVKLRAIDANNVQLLYQEAGIKPVNGRPRPAQAGLEGVRLFAPNVAKSALVLLEI